MKNIVRSILLILTFSTVACAAKSPVSLDMPHPLPPSISLPDPVPPPDPPQTHTAGMLDLPNAWTGNETHSGTETFSNGINTNGLQVNGISGSTQCLHANSSGVVSGTGSDCGSGGGGGAVSSVFGRTGAVVAVPGDYSYSQISSTPTLYNQTIQVSGTPKTQRPNLNLIPGGATTVTCTDNSGASRTDCTIGSAGIPVGINATNGYGLHYDGQVAWGATCTNSNSTITTASNDPPFVVGDVGKIIFGTTQLPVGGTSPGVTLVVGQTTIATFVDAHHITVTVAPTSNCSSLTNVVWGTDDTTPLTNAWAAAIASCSVLMLPAINSEGTQAAMMLVQAAWNITEPSNVAGCLTSTGSSRSGPGIVGPAGQGQSVVVITPNFDPTTCTGHTSLGSTACNLFNVGDGASGGITLANWTIWGDGLNIASSSTKQMIVFGAQSKISNFYCVESGLGFIGMLFDGQLSTPAHGVQSDACGTNVGAKVIGSQARYVMIDGLSYFGDNDQPFWASAGVTVSTGNLFGFAGANKGNVQVDGSAEFISTNDQHILLGDSGFLLQGGTVHITGLTSPATSSTGALIYVHSGTNNIYASNSDLNAGTAFTVYLDGGTGNFNDACGNVFTPNPGILNSGGTLNWNGCGGASGTIGISAQLSGASACVSSQTLFLFPYGQTATSTCSSATAQTAIGGYVAPRGGTLSLLSFKAGTGGVSGDTITVYKNGSSTALTCTYGTGTSCVDQTQAHNVTVASGDLISFAIGTGVADTTKSPQAQVTLF